MIYKENSMIDDYSKERRSDVKKRLEIDNDVVGLLVEITGLLTDEMATNEYTLSHFGITLFEYLSPDIDTLKKVREFMNLKQEENNDKSL